MRIARLAVLATCAGLAACSALDGEKIDYKSATKGATLDVPPDLTQLTRDSRYQVPGGPVSASNYQVGQTVTTVPTAATTLGDVRIERAGNQRWLVVNRPADQLWQPVRDFWQENGFLLVLDQANLGIMETDWAENRAKIPQDFIRNSLGKVFDSLYSSGERDRFRTRMERTPTGATEIYISHRGMQETLTNSSQNTVWQPRPTDPELEAEFLRRLMVKLGVPQEQTKALVATGTPKTTSRVVSEQNTPVVQIDENFDRAWRRVGLALDRTGFTVEDRDRSQGTYFVRYVPPNPDKKEPGFFGKLFGGGEKAEPPVKYRIALKSQGESTTVSVLNAQGAPEASANAQRIVQVIADDLK
ncbi:MULTISPECIES: outer membrane protein assembly factor BamC [Ramlibacter]|uniref:Outer membrane protein assembly factor BamC n=1 Tax=Ramlibacter pinisoli TaxID=2682844 RepID=A0A6N8IPD5_9BURK|nr:MULTISPECIES: outer membrane protein assembly factor BamC [Ramlibacter]MBA2963741.1 outer membrane protein assembly factor BamC [Ramlibacter sp. CGMCC 1.13660]MVQ28707.1 outer membrane protein assembly factor BamC [Ramlibacter pinisoli]